MTNPAYEIIGQSRPARWLVTCDHASNAVPADICGGDLGLPEADMHRHIAYDIGAAGVSRRLAELLDAPAILSRFSRLVIDPNRGEFDPTVMMRLYDGTIIPANHHADAAEKEQRLATYHRPYHDALEHLIQRRDDTIIVAVHSFTPRLYSGTPRPWQIGILYGHDERISRPFITRLQQESDLNVGENEPYAGHLPGDSVDRHGLQKGRPNVLIELRQDLIVEETGQRDWAERLATCLTDALDGAHI